MAKITVKELNTPPPPISITLELSLEEAAVIAKLCGRVCNPGQFRAVSESVYFALETNKRIMRMCDRINTHDLVIPMGQLDIPKE